MSDPIFSVVVPTRDTRDLTLRCLASLRSAEPPPAEVVLVDDGSSDGTSAAVARHHAEVTVLRQETAAGFTAAANRGLGAARGELLLLLNSDTEVDPHLFACLGALFGHHPRLGIAGAELRYPDGSPQWSSGPEPGLLWLFALASNLPRLFRRKPRRSPRGSKVAWVTGAAMALRRRVWEEVGPLDETFTFYAQDLDLCLRAREAGWQVAVATGCRVLHHHGATVSVRIQSATGRQELSWLWSDLIRCQAKHRGGASALWSRRALFLGGHLRRALLAASLLHPARAVREGAHRERDAVARALAAVRALGPGPRDR